MNDRSRTWLWGLAPIVIVALVALALYLLGGDGGMFGERGYTVR